MANEENKESYGRGTFIHGVGATEHLDSSGERIKIDGIDISSLTKDGVFNFEHQSKEASAIVGKILEAKKIFSKEDCENEHHEYFWNKIQSPFLYIAGELFDTVGHQAAKDVAAMLQYDQLDPLHKDSKKLINFSVEGSRLDKRGNTITKCIARKITITITPCNKTCEAEEMRTNTESNPSAEKAVPSDFSFIQNIMDKNEDELSSCQIMQKEEKNYTPKREFTPQTSPEKIKTGDRINYKDQPKAKTGVDIYGKPPKEEPSWKKSEKKKGKKKKVEKAKEDIGKDPEKKRLNREWRNDRVPESGKIKGEPYRQDPLEEKQKRKLGKNKKEEDYEPTQQERNIEQTKRQVGRQKQVVQSKKQRVGQKKQIGQKKRFRKSEKETATGKVTMPAKDAVKEHKRLVDVLESPSHKDDKKEAKKQKKELKEYKKQVKKGTGLPGEFKPKYQPEPSEEEKKKGRKKMDEVARRAQQSREEKEEREKAKQTGSGEADTEVAKSKNKKKVKKAKVDESLPPESKVTARKERKRTPTSSGYTKEQAATRSRIKDKMGKAFTPSSSHPNQGTLLNSEKKKLSKYDSNMRKALAAGGMGGQPSTKVQGNAVEKNINTSTYNYDAVYPSKEGSFPKGAKSEIDYVLSSIDSFSRFPQKKELVTFIKSEFPTLNNEQIKYLAKMVAYYKEQKDAKKLADLMPDE